MATEQPLEKKVQNAIVDGLKGDAGVPAKAAALAKEHLLAAIKGGANAKEAVQQASFGTMSGALLLDADLPKSAVALLQTLADSGSGIGSDPTEVMTWGMEGIVRIAPSAQPGAMTAMSNAINSAFMGAGEIFNRLYTRHL